MTFPLFVTLATCETDIVHTSRSALFYSGPLDAVKQDKGFSTRTGMPAQAGSLIQPNAVPA
jgi:hypothetical protein